MKLDAKTIARLTREASLAGAKADAIYFDENLAGFGLRLRAGHGTWIAQYRARGRTRRMKIGAVEKLDPEPARKQARKILAEVELGHDPQGVKAAERVKAVHTFKAVAELFLAAKRSRLRPSSYRVTELYLVRGPHFRPLHAIAVTDVTLADVASRVRAITTASGGTSAGRARSAISSMYKWAMGEGLLGPNPVNPVIGTNTPPDSVPRERVLDEAELVAIWNASEDDDYGRIVRLLMLTGCRRVEIGGLQWSEINWEKRTLTLPAERVKNKRPHVVPLSDLALDILQSIPQRLSRDRIFGDHEQGNGFGSWGRYKAALDLRLVGQVEPWRLHDLRRTCATGMADLGVLPHVIEAALNHVSGHKAGIAGVYNRSLYEREVKVALATWADHIASLIAHEGPKIVILRQNA